MNKTQIHSIVQTPFESNRGWYVNIKFSIDKDSFYYPCYIDETKKDKLNPLITLKDDIFTYSNAITSCSASIGILQYLKELKENNTSESSKLHLSLESNILRAIIALDQFWD